MSLSRARAPEQGRVVVTIVEIEIDNRTAHCQDRTGATYLATFRQQGGLFVVPNVGDRWVAERVGWTWNLSFRLDSEADHEFLTTLNPGDGRISLEGMLQMAVGGVQINSQPFGATTRDVFYPDGTVASWGLTAAPVHVHTVQAFFNGLLVDPNTYTLGHDGQTLTFVNTPPAGTLVVYFQQWQQLSEDAAVVTGKAVIGQEYDDAATVTSVAVAFRSPTDAGTVSGVAVPSAAYQVIFVDSATVQAAGGVSTIIDTSNQEPATLYDETQGWVSIQIDVP